MRFHVNIYLRTAADWLNMRVHCKYHTLRLVNNSHHDEHVLAIAS